MALGFFGLLRGFQGRGCEGFRAEGQVKLPPNLVVSTSGPWNSSGIQEKYRALAAKNSIGMI